MKYRKEIDYWGTGFCVKLLNFPVYEDEGSFLPDVSLGMLHKFIGMQVISKPYLLTGNEFSFLRSLADLSRSEAARKIGITRRALINWEEMRDEPFKTRAIAHLGIRVFFSPWVSPNSEAITGNIFKFIPEKNSNEFSIKFTEFSQFIGATPSKTPKAYNFTFKSKGERSRGKLRGVR